MGRTVYEVFGVREVRDPPTGGSIQPASAPDAHIHRSTYYNWLKRYDDGGVDALAETIIGLYKTAVIRTRGPWKTLDDVEYATLEWGPTGSTITVCWRPSATCHRLSMKRCTMMSLTGHAKRHGSMYGLLLFLNSS